ncbi:MAG: pilus assembly protein PilM [Firmicutes bacterium]|nr:pilus assembly protein PilM [Bacillota bacterium]
MAINQGIDCGKTNIRRITLKSGIGGSAGVSKGKPARKILILPSNFVSYRQFSFPFTDKKRIRDILPGELIETMVLPPDKLVWDISFIHKENAGALVAIKDQLDTFIKSSGNGVQIVDAEPCALSRAAAQNKVKDALIIDFGATKTTFCGITDGRINLLRVRLIGGEAVTKSIEDERKISPEEAETLKCTEGLHIKSIKRFVDNIINSAALEDPIGYEKVIITGGGAQMPGLAEYLSEKLKTEVGYFKLPEGLSPFTDVIAFGAALYDAPGQEKVNFKKDEQTNGTKSLVWLGISLLIPLILFSISVKMQEAQLEKENRQLVTSMTKAIKKEFPNIGRIDAPVRQVKALIKKESGGEGGSARKVIPMLSEISTARQGLDITLYEIDITDKDIKLKGESDSFQTVDQFRTLLAGKFASAEMQESKTKPNKRVDFGIKISFDKTGDSGSSGKEAKKSGETSGSTSE